MATSITKKLVLITGANTGIGFELAHQLLKKGSYHILLGSRSLTKGTAAVQSLQSRNLPGTVEVVELDVTNDSTISEAAASVQKKYGKLDILVNNAGVALPPGTLREQMRTCFDTNATGPAVLTSAFAPLLQNSTLEHPRIVNISSGIGSLNRCLDPTSPTYKIQAIQYRASKAALSMVTACQWVEYGPKIKVFAYDPGFTQSNLGPHNKAENGARSPEESVMPLVEVLEGKRDVEAGSFLYNTGIWPW
ncbi:NAD(P)-binding protein [Delitschia confertaspora ATCC 74209]|uniref:NAD(P)-binding protein n=1 Tax=Delitschia confertaspora ATCC 74209 TaxID=1513339 RepID=A0A9P4MTS7_9PLEO|nr:NAD(P)-binding protein [Delitschia confertaspora ATCC 74209]